MAVAFFSTWTTYGSWLPGDERGWFSRAKGLQTGDAMREFEATLQLNEDALFLDVNQRRLVEKTIADHCAIRGWTLHAVNCRSNHVHVVVTAAGTSIEVPREQFKAWCTRKLKEAERITTRTLHVRECWWTRRGWDLYIDGDLFDVVAYVRDGQ